VLPAPPVAPCPQSLSFRLAFPACSLRTRAVRWHAGKAACATSRLRWHGQRGGWPSRPPSRWRGERCQPRRFRFPSVRPLSGELRAPVTAPRALRGAFVLAVPSAGVLLRVSKTTANAGGHLSPADPGMEWRCQKWRGRSWVPRYFCDACFPPDTRGPAVRELWAGGVGGCENTFVCQILHLGYGRSWGGLVEDRSLSSLQRAWKSSKTAAFLWGASFSKRIERRKVVGVEVRGTGKMFDQKKKKKKKSKSNASLSWKGAVLGQLLWGWLLACLRLISARTQWMEAAGGCHELMREGSPRDNRLPRRGVVLERSLLKGEQTSQNPGGQVSRRACRGAQVRCH